MILLLDLLAIAFTLGYVWMVFFERFFYSEKATPSQVLFHAWSGF
mgnify:CR=1 FL=1